MSWSCSQLFTSVGYGCRYGYDYGYSYRYGNGYLKLGKAEVS